MSESDFDDPNELLLDIMHDDFRHKPATEVLERLYHVGILPEVQLEDVPEHVVAEVERNSADEKTQPPDVTGNVYPYWVPGTRMWLRWSKISDIRANVMLSLIANQVTNSPHVTVGTTITAALWNNIKRLTEEELEIFKIMQRLTDGAVYAEWIDGKRLLSAIPEGDGDKNRERLAKMASRGILEEHGEMWRAVK